MEKNRDKYMYGVILKDQNNFKVLLNNRLFPKFLFLKSIKLNGNITIIDFINRPEAKKWFKRTYEEDLEYINNKKMLKDIKVLSTSTTQNNISDNGFVPSDLSLKTKQIFKYSK